MTTLNLKPNHKAVTEYYEQIKTLSSLGASKEGAVSPAFATLLRHCSGQFKWTLIEKYAFKAEKSTLFIDGALADNFNLVHGYWEAKDTEDDLEKEIKKKLIAGYPKDNIIFQAPDRVVIYQNGKNVFDSDISKPEKLIEGLRTFFEYQPPEFEQWEQAVGQFKLKVKELGEILLKIIEKEQLNNKPFTEAFEGFTQLCRETINPNISTQAVEEMLIQHILTERIFRKVFNNPDFVNRNTIAHEIEKVVSALTSQSFSRDEFLGALNPFYGAIETTAATITDFSQKQTFLNTVYEKFFQGFSVKIADTHGIVYTPQPIVNFMVKSVEYILQKEFGRSLSDENVHIIDPFVGTGNFIVRIMREMQKTKLPQKYANELHCNEVLLLPYYISSMNIEHAYYELTGKYVPFEGICLVDTFDVGNVQQFTLFTSENTARVKKQQSTPIFVIIGNPPYNVGQVNENDNNKNRKYEEMDNRVSQTYGKGSKATLLRKLSDPYVKAIRWASDRIADEGIVAFVTNNSFIDGVTFDAMRKCSAQDFDEIFILDLGGNVRENPKLSGTTHNVFGIQVGVSISILVKSKSVQQPKQAKIYYSRLDKFWRKEQKYNFLNEKEYIGNIVWDEIQPDAKYNWLTKGIRADFDTFISLGTKESKSSKETNVEAIFKLFSLGVSTNRESLVYSFDKEALEERVKQFGDDYNTEVSRYIQKGKPNDIDKFVNYTLFKWSRNLKRHLKTGDIFNFIESNIRTSLYRPFTKQWLYFSDIIVDEPGTNRRLFPNVLVETDNLSICVKGIGMDKPFHVLMVPVIPDLQFTPNGQCFPLFIYSEDGTNRQENITNWALIQFRTHYNDDGISKLDIFYYVYGILHHPSYREKYAANLKRELPRIPLAPAFWDFANAGAKLAELHVNYEKVPEYKLKLMESKEEALDWRVEKMKLSADKTQIKYNNFLTLAGIPPEVFEYRLGNRSALDWIIDQYQVSTDKRSGITNDPNRADDLQYIVQLIGQVITVSLETMKIVKSLPSLE